MTHVPYRNTGQSVADLAAGHVALGFVEAGASIPLIKDGKLRALAVSASTTLPLLPDVPPFSQAAGAPDFEAVSWHVLFAPAKTPKEIVDRLHAEMKRIMAEPEMKARAAAIGLIPFDTPSIEGIQGYINSEQEKWGALVKRLGLAGTQ
jgi:tripartite-type tricarboxylate transporter receptor subunit TctC